MQPEPLSVKTIAFIVAIFLALVCVHLFWGGDVEETSVESARRPRLSRIQVLEDGKMVDLETHAPLPGADTAEALRTALQNLGDGSTSTRRIAALQLAYMTGRGHEQQELLRLDQQQKRHLEQALFRGLRDTDEVVARHCAEALIGWWRLSPRAMVTRHLMRGLSALESGDHALALKTYESLQELGPPLPPDLYRLEAEAHLALRHAEKALDSCNRALEAEPRHFAALLARARAQHRLERGEEALSSAEEALAIYPNYSEALELRARLSETDEGGR